MAREKLSKAEIVENIFPLVKVSKKNIHKIIDLFFDQIKAGLLGDRVIELRGPGHVRDPHAQGPQGAQSRKPETPWSSETTAWPISAPGRELKQKVWDLRS